MAENTDPNDFEALARRYWGMWGDAMREAGTRAGMGSPMDGYRDALDAWTRSASGARPDFDGVLANFNRQGKAWLAQMQQVAAQFAGRDHSASEIAAAWRQALGPAANPFASLFSGMDGAGMLPLEQWQGAAESWLQGTRHQVADWLGMPAFGFAREHQERLQAIGKAQLRLQEAFAEYQQMMAGAGQDAYARFEAKLAEREEPGRQLASVRALFDLWVEAAEEAYAKVALSTEYRHAYGALVNAQMELRAGQQAIVEQAGSALGLPGRTELDSAHRKLAELERQLRRLQRQGEAASPGAEARGPRPAAAKPAAKAPVQRAASKNVSPAKGASGKAAAAKAAAGKPPKPPKPPASPARRSATRPTRTTGVKPASAPTRRKR